MSDHWPLLVSDPIDGDRMIIRQLRPRAAAVPISRTDFDAARQAVIKLCGTWDGGSMPLMPVTPASQMDMRWSRILMQSNIDGIQESELLSKEEYRKYTDMHGDSTQGLLRIIVDLERKPTVQTCRDVPEDDPWYLAYLATLGDLSPWPDQMNTWNDLRADLTYQDVLAIRNVEGEPGAAQLLSCLRDYTATSAVDLSRIRLSSGLQASFNKGILPEQSRFEWDDDRVARQYGPNIVVVYQPESVDDLALIWNLRARFIHPPKFPLALPLTDTTEQDLRHWLSSGADHNAFNGYLALTSFSVSQTDLTSLSNAVQADTIEPWQLLRPIYGCCVTSTEMARFSHGSATIPRFSPTEIQTLGQSFLGRHQGSWMKLKTTIARDPLPFSREMRHGDYYGDAIYLDGQITSGGEPSSFATIRQPAGLEVLAALAADAGVTATESPPGRAAEQLIRAAGPELSMFASPGVVDALSELTRGRHVSLVKRRLNDFLGEPGIDETSDRYQLLFDRLDNAVGLPDPEEARYATFNHLKNLLKISAPAARRWLQWAMSGQMLLRGVEANCKQCGYKQWRPLTDTVPVLICHGCGQNIDNPHGFNHVEYRYRASEILLRAMADGLRPPRWCTSRAVS